MSETMERAREWCYAGERGISSETICEFFTGWPLQARRWGAGYPLDPADFNRCRKLLEAVPEWRGRIVELAALGPVWAALVERWDEIERTFHEEAQGRERFTAPRTFALMQEIIRPAEQKGRASE